MNENGEWVTENGYYDTRWSNFNCYAYSINRCELSNFYNSSFQYQPGDMSGEGSFGSITNIYDLALLVQSDLIAMGYSNISLSYTMPNIGPTQELICVRMRSGVDYHFMRYDYNSNYYKHSLYYYY